MWFLLNVLSYFFEFFSDIVQVLLVFEDVLGDLGVEDSFQGAGKHFGQTDVLDVRGGADEGDLAEVAHIYALDVEDLFEGARVDWHYY